jgi:hypothetical protein
MQANMEASTTYKDMYMEVVFTPIFLNLYGAGTLISR